MLTWASAARAEKQTKAAAMKVVLEKSMVERSGGGNEEERLGEG
jgi:hypothetical protein